MSKKGKIVSVGNVISVVPPFIIGRGWGFDCTECPEVPAIQGHLDTEQIEIAGYTIAELNDIVASGVIP